MKDSRLEHLPQVLLPWYETHKRNLPWRQDREPYHIWLSEIMLQQTRVEAVKGYYARFLQALPTIAALAACDDEKLHKLWEGLGYYSRVRNLKKCANVIMTEYGGEFPTDHKTVLSLPGIGPYTAGAICSIAFSQPTPAVDGNVLRVLSRIRADSAPIDEPAVKKRVEQELAEIYPVENPGAFTQALMELGATVCVPNGAPQCEYCPCRGFCAGQALWQSLPVKLPKRAKKQENRTVFVLRCGEEYAIEKRPAKGLLAGLWQFPNISGFLELEQAIDWCRAQELRPAGVERMVERNHIFTHIRWDMRCYYLQVGEKNPNYTWKTLKEIDEQAALPTAFRQFREELTHV